MKIAAVLFDFDMTLADSVDAIAYCLNRVAEDKGLRALDREEVAATIGLPMTEACQVLWGGFDPAWVSWYGEHYREDEYARLALFPDAVPVLTALRSRGIRTGVVSNRRYARRVVDRVGLAPLCDVVVGLEDGIRGKPDPELLLRALALVGCGPGEAWYVGDTAADMTAARAAGMRALGVTRGSCGAETLRAAGAHVTAASLDEAVRLFEASAPSGVSLGEQGSETILSSPR